jgi:thiamine transport system substrate-binding protein
VCVNWDGDAFGADLAPPQKLEDLADPAYRGMLVVENPATSSPGLAFLLATIVRFGEEGGYTWRDYWRELRDNDVLVSAGWEDAYYGSFSGGAGEGDRPLVVSYATSPAAEVYFADPPTNEAPTGVLADGCFRQVEFAGILAGTKAESSARALIDFLLSADFQEDVPLQMFVYPADPTASLPDVFVEHAQPIADPITLDPATIGAGREGWIEEWTDVVLH